MNSWIDNNLNSKVMDNIMYDFLINNNNTTYQKTNLIYKPDSPLVDQVKNLFNLYKFKNYTTIRESKNFSSFILPNIEKFSCFFFETAGSDFYKNLKYLKYVNSISKNYRNSISETFNSIYQTLNVTEIRHFWNPMDSLEPIDSFDDNISDLRYLEMLNNNVDYDNFFSNISTYDYLWKYFINTDSNFTDQDQYSADSYLNWSRENFLMNICLIHLVL
jgi:hypothetical protein